MFSSSPATEAGGKQLRYPSVFWPTVWFVIALVATKASYVKLSPFWSWARSRDYFSWLYVQWLAAAAHADVIFAVGVGMLAAGVLALLRSRPRLAKLIVGVFVLYGFLGIVYALISREAFAYYGAPFTFQLLALVGEPARLRSSIETFVTVPLLSALVGIPAGYVLLSWGTWRLDGNRAPIVRSAIRAGFCIALIALLLIGRSCRIRIGSKHKIATCLIAPTGRC